MNKDVIYIDVEDDITAVITKVKASKEKIVALVPPKHVGVLQSAVNLRLLHRAAEQSDKRLVLITNNHALSSLAAAAKLPVAKNLQSKPELAEVTALETDDADDVIDGNDLSIGDHAGQDDDSAKALAAAPVLTGTAATMATAPKDGAAGKPKVKNGTKVPNFNTFRKKMIFAFVAGVLLIAFLVWAIFFAPRATVVVSAKTDDTPVNVDLTAGDKLSTDLEENTVKAVVTEESQEKSSDFDATGSKNVGKKATGTVEFSNSSTSNVSISAGTNLKSSSGLVFVTTEPVSVPAGTLPCGNFSCPTPGTAAAGVEAKDKGAKYNAASGGARGAPSNVTAQFDGPTSGGTDKVVKVVTASDVQKARESFVEKDTEEVTKRLQSKFGSSVKPLNESFRVDYGDVTSSPSVGEEAENGTAKLSGTVVYRLYGVETAELSTYLDKYLAEELDGQDDRRVFDDGADDAQFQDVDKTKDGSKFTLVVTAKVGPKLDENKIKEIAKGNKFGDIQQSVQAIEGVESVDIKFFPFWVSAVPNDTGKITVQFKVDE